MMIHKKKECFLVILIGKLNSKAKMRQRSNLGQNSGSAISDLVIGHAIT
jgi:hypothetical protein